MLIAGPTASGKSALALRIAERFGGVIVNADAIQVYDNWRVLTARPTPQDCARTKHALYGHVPYDTAYSVGHWLRDLEPWLCGSDRPIIVGGTGLYFSALTQGLADIPTPSADIRADADQRLAADGLQAMVNDLDDATRGRIDLRNPMRVQRAWEVLRHTGRGLAAWQRDTPPPRLPVSACHALLFDMSKEVLTPRIEQRFDAMIAQGALDEVRANLSTWDPAWPSSKAIGAPELVEHLTMGLSLSKACHLATIATRQFAKRQRTWFRSRFSDWHRVTPDMLAP